MKSSCIFKNLSFIISSFIFYILLSSSAHACTAISLKAEDGDLLMGRTMEWGMFNFNSEIRVVPRNYEFIGSTPDKKPGLKWKSKYGFTGITVFNKNAFTDGINEKGLVVALLYHPNFAKYSKYDPNKADETMGPLDVITFLLTTCENVNDVREAMKKIKVTSVIEPALKITPPVHFIVTDQKKHQIVIEFKDGEVIIYDAPLGVLTNDPFYDWQITNLRNYLFLKPESISDKKIKGINFAPLGVGSGMLGMPGDFTPPSRFVRAVYLSSTARKTPNGPETLYEMFQILDNFNVPLTPEEAKKHPKMRSDTQWTVVSDTKNLVLYYHTQNNRRVRMVDLNKINFANTIIVKQPLDKIPEQDIQNVTP